MHEVVTTMTQRSQVTVPAEVRRLLGLKPRDRVAFEIDGDEVRLKPVKWTLESVAGSVKPLHDGPQDFDEMIRQAKEEVAERSIEKMKRQ
jgi:AbrB family looped-hinge helix DNA binding protein